ncbi:MAG: pilus assembly protein PilP [Deltaproteobacteria bacterium]|nr:pilus assembly protein PilP [Deltaproteobacteria bacterium]
MKLKRTEERGARMGIRGALLLFLALTLVSMTLGCGEEAVTTNAPTAADMENDRAALMNRAAHDRKPNQMDEQEKADPIVAATDGETAEYAGGERDYFYDPRNKRDPFRSFRYMNDSGREQNFGPLGDFEVGQLELSAVIWDANNPRALVLDPGGRSYIVREGSQIGKNSGQVIHIGDNLVLVKETYENFAGERTTKDVELRIRLSQGG